jgi:hypothetical protein
MHITGDGWFLVLSVRIQKIAVGAPIGAQDTNKSSEG